MTVPQQPTRTAHVGNGITTIFAYDFLCLAARDLQVIVAGAVVDPSAYTVSNIGQSSGGDVTFLAPPADQAQIVIQLDMVLDRETDYQTNGDLFAKTVNFDFDRLWLAIQQAFGYLNRVPRLGDSDVDGAGAYRAKGNRIQDIGDPLNDQDAVNRRSMWSYVESAVAGVVGGFGWFLQLGSGSIPRTFQDKMRDTVSVRDFDAAADGITLDTAAFTKALASPAKDVYVPAGTYLVDSFTIPAGKKLYGPGILKWAANATTSMIILGGAGATIDCLGFDANGVNQLSQDSTLPMIASAAAPGAQITNCEFWNGRGKLFVSDVALSPRMRVMGNTVRDWGTGHNPDVFTFKSSRYICSGNHFDNINPTLDPVEAGHCIRTGLYGSDPTTNPVVNGTIFGNVFENSRGVGITVELYTQGLSISGNTMRNMNQGVKVESQGGTQSRISIVGNEFIQINGTTAFNLTGNNVLLTGNTFKDCNGYVDLGNGCVCSSNIFDNCGNVSASAPSIRATSSSFANCIVQGNVILNAPWYGVIMSAGGVCNGNVILNPGLRGISVSGANTRVIGNIVRGAAHQYGIITDSSSAGCVVSGNDCAGATIQNYQLGERLLSFADASNTGYTGLALSTTISSDAVTAPRNSFSSLVVDTEGGLPTDTLSTINVSGGGYVGQVIVIRIASASRTVTVNNAGNIRLAGGSVTLSNSQSQMQLMWNGTTWQQISAVVTNS